MKVVFLRNILKPVKAIHQKRGIRLLGTRGIGGIFSGGAGIQIGKVLFFSPKWWGLSPPK